MKYISHKYSIYSIVFPVFYVMCFYFEQISGSIPQVILGEISQDSKDFYYIPDFGVPILTLAIAHCII